MNKSSQSMFERWQDPEYRKKMSDVHTGHRHSAETRAKMSRSRKGHRVSEETKEKIRNKLVGRKITWSDKISETVSSHSAEMSAAHKARWANPDFRERVTQSIKARFQSPEIRAKMSAAHKKRWSNEQWAASVIRATFDAANKSPNKTELRLMGILNETCPGEYRFVGDGTLIVGRRSPDFVCGRRNLIIELFGDYWHFGEDPQERIDYFSSHGYSTLVVWESELSDIEKLKNRILTFHSGATT